MSEEKPTYPSRIADQFVVRFPDGMRDRLKEAAAANGRSMNAEIIARLSASFDHQIPAELKLIEKLGEGPSLVDDINSALEEVSRVAKELRQIRRIPLPAGTKVSSDRLALVRPLMHLPKARTAGLAPPTSVVGKRMRAKQLKKRTGA